jgi:predicted metalloprotease
MRWQGRRESTNVEDRRGRGPAMRTGAGIGCGGLLLVLVLAFATGQDPLALLQVFQATQVQVPDAGAAIPGDAAPPGDELGRFASVVLADLEETWSGLFTQAGVRYRPPTLVLYSGAVQSACGMSSAASGPFYCPADERVYIDLSFFDELDRRFGAPGDFAQAYVIAHEVGHHVQNLLGIAEQVQTAQERAYSKREANQYSVAMELQADCLAGVWAHHAHRERQLLEPGDVEEGLAAAAAIGDDRMQRRATGTVQPETWTHGSSEQRVAWLRRGLEGGDPDACETLR